MKKHNRRIRLQRLLFAGLLASAATTTIYFATRPGPRLLSSPAVTPEVERALLGAIVPGWPSRKPVLPVSGGPLQVVAGRVDAIAALDQDGDGRTELGVAYTFFGPGAENEPRTIVPGFAVLRAGWGGAPPILLYEAPQVGGWEGPSTQGFSGATEVSSRVQAVQWGRREVGFLVTHTVETGVGGRLARGVTRAILPFMKGWVNAWEQVTEQRLRAYRWEEVSVEGHPEVIDLDGNGVAELVVTSSWYHRHLDRKAHGPHFTAEGPGRLIYRRDGARFTLAAIDGVGQPRPRIRSAPPLYAVRCPSPPQIDGKFDDWDAVELTEITALSLDEPEQLRYKRRERAGTHDFSAALRFMWDTTALYVRADVMDDVVRISPPGSRLSDGDHLALWLDTALARDFAVSRRDGDDWHVGLAPGAGTSAGRVAGGEAWTWLPSPGRYNTKVASAPLIDPYEGAVRGWRLEAAIPWRDVSGPPPGLSLGGLPDRQDARQERKPRRYTLRLAGMLGLAAVLTDGDKEANEQAYVSADSFAPGEPRTFNTLLLVEGRRER